MAAGRGSRLNIDYPKALFKIGNTPLIDNSLKYAWYAKVDGIILVVSKDNSVIDYCGIDYRGIPVTYVRQLEQLGVVNAIECAEKALDDDDFMLLHSDEVMEGTCFDEMVKQFKGFVSGIIGCVWDSEENIRKSYSVITDRNNEYAIRLIEKPRYAQTDYPKGTGCVIFRNDDVFRVIKEVLINPISKEQNLTDLIQCVVDDSYFGFKVFMVADSHVNVNTLDDVKSLNIDDDGDDKHD